MDSCIFCKDNFVRFTAEMLIFININRNLELGNLGIISSFCRRLSTTKETYVGGPSQDLPGICWHLAGTPAYNRIDAWNSVPTWQKTRCVYITKTNRLMLFREILQVLTSAMLVMVGSLNNRLNWRVSLLWHNVHMRFCVSSFIPIVIWGQTHNYDSNITAILPYTGWFIRKRPRINNYKTRNNVTDENEISWVHTVIRMGD
jgi:hypothetical protein